MAGASCGVAVGALAIACAAQSALANGLTYTDAVGNALQVSGGSVLWRRTNTPSTDKNAVRPAASGITYPTNGIWMSALLQFSAAGGLNYARVGFIHGANNTAYLGFDTSGRGVALYEGVTKGTTSTTYATGATHMIVGHIGPTGLLDFWIDPTNLALEESNTASQVFANLSFGNPGGLAFPSIRLSARPEGDGSKAVSTSTFDEIRFGTSWEDVVPIPEPGAFALLALAVPVLAARRRRGDGASVPDADASRS